MLTRAPQRLLTQGQAKLPLKQQLLLLSCKRLAPGSKKVTKCILLLIDLRLKFSKFGL